MQIEIETAWRGNLPTKEARLRYLLGGKATFTLESLATNTRFTYRITRKEYDTKVFYFVAVLVGPDNWTNYKYAGLLDPNTLQIKETFKSKIKSSAPSMVALQWSLIHLEAPSFDFWHEGNCGVCGRKLTVPESIASGIGPICANR